MTGVLVAAWLLRTPTPDAATLTKALQHSSVIARAPKVETLCFSEGISHGNGQPVNVEASNSATLEWMDRLASLGLYAPRENRNESGLFGVREIALYRPTAELSKWTRDNQLCLGSGIQADNVDDIAKVEDNAELGTVYKTVKGQARWRAEPMAPWVTLPDAAVVVKQWQGRTGGDWKLDKGRLVSSRAEQFIFADRRWMSIAEFSGTTDGAAKVAQIAPQSGHKGKTEAATPTSSSGEPGLWQRFTGLFSFQNPLIGTWRLDLSADIKALTGRDLPDDTSGPTISFTKYAMRQSGIEVAVTYEKDGDTIVVKPQVGEQRGVGMRFTLTGPDAITSPFGKFKRVSR